MKKYYIIIILVFAAFHFYAQHHLHKADRLFQNFAYFEALHQYILHHNHHPEDNVKLQIIRCYEKLKQPSKVVLWCDSLSDKSLMSAHDSYHYARSLLSTQRYNEAKKWFKYCLNQESNHDLAERSLNEMKHMEDWFLHEKDYHIHNLSFNSQYADFGAIEVNKGIVFASSHESINPIHHTYAWNHTPFLDLYFIDSIGDLTKLKGINTALHDGPAAVNQDMTKIVFTSNGKHMESQDHIKKLHLYQAEKNKESKEWHQVKSLSFNDISYSTMHPTVDSTFTTLIFSSDMPGGYGGQDLYISTFEYGKWSKPVNLGNQINTEGDEIFPFLHVSGELYFSSDGWGGMGGLDIFKALPLMEGYKMQERLPYPINSHRDDFSFYLNENEITGMFSSNRENGIGDDDIYSFKLNFIDIQGTTFMRELDRKTRLRLEDTEIQVYDLATNELVDTSRSSTKGDFTLRLPTGKKYRLIGVYPELASDTIFVDLTKSKDKAYDRLEMVLIKEPIHTLTGSIVDHQSKEPIKGIKAYLLDHEVEKKYPLELSDSGTFVAKVFPNKTYTIKSFKNGYLSSCTEVFTEETKKKEMVIQAPVKMEKLNVNKVFEIHNIYFDLDKSNIRQDAAIELDKIVKFLKEHPNISIELGSHTDARGNNSYNQKLSERRALSSIKYIISKGIPYERLQAKGYGEAKLANDCKDGVNCSEEAHQRNRRTEIKIVEIAEGNEDIEHIDNVDLFEGGAGSLNCEDAQIITSGL